MDWSYDLLTEAERVLLRRLSLFAGGFTLAAAEAVCAGEEMDALEVLDLLTHLTDKSLVLVENPADGEADGVGGPRYRLLETIRQYGQEKLRETSARGEEVVEALRRRHRDAFLQLAEEAEPELRGPRQREWLERLERDHDNLRAALTWSVEAGHREAEAGLRLGGALGQFWYVRGLLTEGRERLAALLALAEVRTAARAKALSVAGNLAFRQGEFGTARALHQECLAIRRELGDRRGMSHSLNNLAIVAMDQGDYGAVRTLHEEGMAIQRELGDQRGLALSLNNMGNLAYEQGEFGEARSLYTESLTIKRHLGDRHAIANSLVNLGNLALEQGENEEARSLYEESLAIQRELGDKRGIATALYQLGKVAQAQEEYGEAQALHAQSLAIHQELGDKLGIAQSLECLAEVAETPGQAARAARLFGAAEALRNALGAPRPPRGRAELERHAAGARASLGEEAFAAAWAEGQALPLEQVLEYALEKSGDAPSLR